FPVSQCATHLLVSVGAPISAILAILAILAMLLACPESPGIVLPDRLQLGRIGLRRWLHAARNLQLPSGVGEHILDVYAGVVCCQEGFAIVWEAQTAFCGDPRRRPSAHQAHALAPARAVPIARTSDVVHPLRQAMPAVLQQRDKPLRQGGNVT